MLDAIQPAHNLENTRKPRRRFRFRFFLTLSMLTLLVFGIFVGSKLVIFAQKILDGSGAVFSFRQLFLAPDKKLMGEEQEEIRILLLGIGGQSHEGGTLTDTMILATLKLRGEENHWQIGLVSIPRDLVVNIPMGYNYGKINSAYAYGEAANQKQGPSLALQTVELVLGQDIPYYGVIDFDGFKKIIDDLGGVEINVAEGFTDYQYPDEKLGYLPPVTFEVGRQKMDGTRALQYVRSRHGTNNQGSDFARAKRQQQLLKAVKEEITSFKVFLNLNLIDRLLMDLGDHIRTNLKPHELKRLYDLVKDTPSENITSLALDNQGGLLCDQIAEDTKAYLLVPCEGLGSYSAIRETVKNQFLISGLQAESAKIEIQNASSIPALAQQSADFLRLPYLEPVVANFKGQINYRQSIIYDNTKGQKPKTLAYVREKLGIELASSPFPFSTATPGPDFVIIVAADLEGKF